MCVCERVSIRERERVCVSERECECVCLRTCVCVSRQKKEQQLLLRERERIRKLLKICELLLLLWRPLPAG